ncbi:amidohydrolase family protein [Flagellimonas hymeniacidonis]|uniref:Amidohydrolase family protein n=1 Tax=Flagellimonas hymeniacidonis TaxID=2603628 RepID=A0A5C8V3N6_9FLAO|nr:amidohydrolase family protein [Flagellimonas hymeniacidonis]TXN35941.1 amidohydrolase family protein [Flagellimonas hymeniacidonis]
MRNLIFFVALFLFHVYVTGQTKLSNETKAYVSYEKGTYLLQNLTLIDGNGTAAKTNQDILIVNDKIEKVGADLIAPENATVINMMGKSAIPGLVMLHEHLFYPKSTPEHIYGVDQMSYSFPKLYLAAGVTTMRTAGSIMPQSDVNIKKAIQNGNTPGPNMDVTSPHLDREGLGIYELGAFNSTEQFVNAINFYADMGVTSIKVYNFITRNDLKAIVKAAHARNMKVTGHLCSITYREAADIGIDNLEHGFFASSDFIENKTDGECQPFEMHKSMLNLPIDSEKVTDLIAHLVKKNVALTSTINVFEPYTNREVVPGGGIDALFTNSKDKVYKRWASKQGKDSLDYVLFNKSKVWEKMFFDAGGLLVAGTDPTYDGRIVAGYANMRLLELFVEMGFTIPEAIQIASFNGAKYLEQEASIGTIEPSKTADLVIIDGDISKDISAIRSIETVFKNGIGYDSKKLFAAAKGLVGIR